MARLPVDPHVRPTRRASRPLRVRVRYTVVQAVAVTFGAILLAVVAAGLGAAVAWSYLVESFRRHWPPHPSYCGEQRCIRQTGHPGAHVDDSGRSWQR